MSKKILVVDDEPDILKVVIFRIKKLGYDVSIASNGQEALDMLKDDHPGLIIMDIAMPVMDGLTATVKIRENGAYNDIAILILTASKLTDGLEERVLESGANGLITKPFEAQDFISAVQNMLPL